MVRSFVRVESKEFHANTISAIYFHVLYLECGSNESGRGCDLELGGSTSIPSR